MNRMACSEAWAAMKACFLAYPVNAQDRYM